MKISHVLIVCSIVTFSACGSSKDTASKEQNSTEVNQQAQPATSSSAGNTSSTASTSSTSPQMTENTQPGGNKEEVKYRLILSFISIGEGTDATARETMDKILQSWEAKTGKKLAMETYPWGREGEVDFCFLLDELNATDQAALARELREAFQLRPLVQIYEYQACMHKK